MCPLPCLTRSLWSSQTPLSHPTLSSSSPEVTALLNFFFMLTHTHTSLCRWWLQPWNSKTLAPWKKSYDKPSHCIKKQRYQFTDKGLYSQSLCGCESWTINKAECWRIDAFKLWCWRRPLRVPWTARRSTLNIHWKDWCWNWSSNTLATGYEELTY